MKQDVRKQSHIDEMYAQQSTKTLLKLIQLTPCHK